MPEILVLMMVQRLVLEADRLSIGKVRGARTSSAGSTKQISLQTLKTVVMIIQRTVKKTIESVLIEKACLNPDPQAASV